MKLAERKLLFSIYLNDLYTMFIYSNGFSITDTFLHKLDLHDGKQQP